MKALEPYDPILFSVTTLILLSFFIAARFKLGKEFQKISSEERKKAENIFLILLVLSCVQLFRVLFLRG